MNDLYIIVGMGVTGFSCAHYLNKHDIPFGVIDSRDAPPQLSAFQQAFPQAPMAVGGLDHSLLHQATHIVLSPGVSLKEPAIAKQVKAGVSVIGDIELFAQAVKKPVIAITGTNAKSTVTTLVGLMMQEAGYHVAVGGNLGVPVLELMDDSVSVYVLELSSFQLETTYSLTPQVATVLNITPDHMDRYASVEEYRQAKHRVYQGCQIAVCNLDDPLTEYHQASSCLHFTLLIPR